MDNNNKIKIDSVQFANIETPVFRPSTSYNGKKYINYGDNNLFPQDLVFYSNKSVTHQACLSLIKTSIAGEGYTTDNESFEIFLSKQDYETANSTILEKISTDFSLFDGFALEVIWNKKGDKIAEIHHIPFQNLRAGDPDRYGFVDKYYYNTDWQNQSTKWEEISSFQPNKSKDFPSQILYISFPNVQNIVYPIPSYSSAINYIVSEYELSKFNLSSVVNGFLPSAIVNFVGTPTTEERKMNKKLFTDNFTGSENAGKVIITYSESADEKVTVSTISQNSSVDNYMNSSQENKHNIITAHNVISPSLIAISDGGSTIFGNGDELLVAWDVFYRTKISSYQKMIEKTFNLIGKYSGFENSNFKIIPFTPISLKQSTDTTPTTDNTDITQ